MKSSAQSVRNIFSAYQPLESSAISHEEIVSYINSVDFLQFTLQFTKTAFIIIEYKTWSYLFTSSNLMDVLGHDPEELKKAGPEVALKLYHPDDLVVQEEIHLQIVDYFRSLPAEDKSRYKFSFTSRLFRADGTEVQLLQNNYFLKWDIVGNPLVKLMTFTDITAYKQNNDVVFYVTHLPDSGPGNVVYQQNLAAGANIALSPREREVLELMSLGLSTTDIISRLTIEAATLKNHKRSIRTKLGCTNSAQMVSLGKLYGLLPTNRMTDVN